MARKKMKKVAKLLYEKPNSGDVFCKFADFFLMITIVNLPKSLAKMKRH